MVMTVFTQVGIQHFDLIFPDGTTPPKDILLKFLSIAEMAPAAIAVHCKAGLGRTGSLIGAYIIKHYRMTAKEVIAWMRFCRPGSVIGQQQIWLEKIESWLWRIGSQYRVRKYGECDKIPRHRYGIYSKQWPREKEKMINEARKNIQRTFTKSQLEKISKQKRVSASVDSISPNQRSLKNSSKTNTYKSVSKLLSSVHGINSNNVSRNSSIFSVDSCKKCTIDSKTSYNFSNHLPFKNHMKVIANQTEFVDHDRHLQFSTGHLNLKSVAVGSDRPNHGKERISIHNTTQGDKLNEIKAARCKIMSRESFDKSRFLPKDPRISSISQSS